MIVQLIKKYEKPTRKDRYLYPGTQLDVTDAYGRELIDAGMAKEVRRVRAIIVDHPPAKGEKRKFTTEKPKTKNAKKSS